MSASPLSTPPVALASPPAWALLLGYAGLIPFAAGALWLWGVPGAPHPLAAPALAAYGAVIVSFLGGIHWGLAFAHPPAPAPLFGWGVVPSLVAWLALLLPHPAGLSVLGAMLVLAYAVDRRVYRRHGLAHWLPLRLHLSAIAALCCAAGAVRA